MSLAYHVPNDPSMALWRLMGWQARKAGVLPDIMGHAGWRARAIKEEVRAELPGTASWEALAIEVLKRWRVELCTLVLEYGRHA